MSPLNTATISLACLLPLLGGGSPARAEQSGDTPRAQIQTVVVSASKRFDPAADAEATLHVQTALQTDPYIYDSHITIETRNGVVYLKGFVFDLHDLFAAMRIARKNSGGRRVVNRLELVTGGSD